MPTTLRTKTGLAIAALLALVDVVSAFFPTPDGEDGPPLGVLVLGGILGVLTLALVRPAWRGNRTAARVAVGARILSALSAVPAFFVDVPAGILVAVAAGMLWLSPSREWFAGKPIPEPVKPGQAVRDANVRALSGRGADATPSATQSARWPSSGIICASAPGPSTRRAWDCRAAPA